LLFLDKSGAPERKNLEPFDSDQLLSELEDWAEILKAEPEVVRRLEAITAQDDAECEAVLAPEPPELAP
jgi:hypothetical protein